jgi:hypoxia up-regulated 1
MGRSRAPLVALVAVLFAMAGGCSASLMAIDFGSEYLKVCLIKPGKIPIAIVVNEMSKRKTPALVGEVAGDRVSGEEASSLAVRYPDLIFSRVRDVLGRTADDPMVVDMLKEHKLPYELVNDPVRKTAAFKINSTTSYLAEELQVSHLQHFCNE